MGLFNLLAHNIHNFGKNGQHTKQYLCKHGGIQAKSNWVNVSAFMLTQIWDISIELRFDLGSKNLEFALASNFEARPCLAEIWLGAFLILCFCYSCSKLTTLCKVGATLVLCLVNIKILCRPCLPILCLS